MRRKVRSICAGHRAPAASVPPSLSRRKSGRQKAAVVGVGPRQKSPPALPLADYKCIGSDLTLRHPTSSGPRPFTKVAFPNSLSQIRYGRLQPSPIRDSPWCGLHYLHRSLHATGTCHSRVNRGLRAESGLKVVSMGTVTGWVPSCNWCRRRPPGPGSDPLRCCISAGIPPEYASTPDEGPAGLHFSAGSRPASGAPDVTLARPLMTVGRLAWSTIHTFLMTLLFQDGLQAYDMQVLLFG